MWRTLILKSNFIISVFSKLSQNFDLLTQTSEKKTQNWENNRKVWITKFKFSDNEPQIWLFVFDRSRLALDCFRMLELFKLWQIWFCSLKRSVLSHSFTSVYLEQWFHSKFSPLSITLWENPPQTATLWQIKQMHNRAMLSLFPHKDLRFVFKIFVRDSDKMVKERMVTSSNMVKMGLWNGDSTSALPYSHQVCAFFILSFKWRKHVFCAFFFSCAFLLQSWWFSLIWKIPVLIRMRCLPSKLKQWMKEYKIKWVLLSLLPGSSKQNRTHTTLYLMSVCCELGFQALL